MQTDWFFFKLWEDEAHTCSVVPGYLHIETSFIWQCLAANIPTRVKHQLEPSRSEGTMQNPYTGQNEGHCDLQGFLVWG